MYQEFSFHKLSVEPDSYEKFYRSQWQENETSLLYTIYRIVNALYFLITLVISVLRYPSHSRLKWLIFLTDWGYVVNTFQALISSYLVIEMNLFAEKTLKFPFPATLYHRKLCQIYWISHTIAVDIAFAISSMYWTMIYDPSKDNIDFLNISRHVANSVVMATDLLLVAHPLHLLHIYWPIGFGLVYVLFTYLYYLLHGTDEDGNPYIYKILNWEDPINSIVTSIIGLFYITLLHALAYCLYLLRTFLYEN